MIAHTNERAPDLNDANWQIPTFDQRHYAAKRYPHVLVIPVINEGPLIRAQLERIKETALPVDVVVADGGSTDGSLEEEFIANMAVRAVLTKTGQGRLSAQLRMAYAWCLRQGYQGIVTIDGNGKDDISAIPDFLHRLDAGFDYIQGSRYRAGGRAVNTPLERTIGNRFVHAPLLSLAGRRWYTDTTNGFRGYSARYLLDPGVAPFRDTFMNYELLFYLTVRAGQLGYRTCEVPVWRSYPAHGITPTKITGVAAKAAILRQTLSAALGLYNP
jgi:dolichol-phosphate mannosyltransferase